LKQIIYDKLILEVLRLLQAFWQTLDLIKAELDEYSLEPVVTFEEPGRFSIHINEYMRDPGFAYDNMLLNVFMDAEERVMFIGLLRIPNELRKTGIGSRVLKHIMNFVQEHHFFIYLDACYGSQPFWLKQGFNRMFYDRNRFDIMGYSADQWDIFWEWEDFRQTKIFQTFLSDHDL